MSIRTLNDQLIGIDAEIAVLEERRRVLSQHLEGTRERKDRLAFLAPATGHSGVEREPANSYTRAQEG